MCAASKFAAEKHKESVLKCCSIVTKPACAGSSGVESAQADLATSDSDFNPVVFSSHPSFLSPGPAVVPVIEMAMRVLMFALQIAMCLAMLAGQIAV